jgi:hypothetical protein
VQQRLDGVDAKILLQRPPHEDRTGPQAAKEDEQIEETGQQAADTMPHGRHAAQ